MMTLCAGAVASASPSLFSSGPGDQLSPCLVEAVGGDRAASGEVDDEAVCPDAAVDDPLALISGKYFDFK